MNKKISALLICLMFIISVFGACTSNEEDVASVSSATNVSVYRTGQSTISSTTLYSGTISSQKSVSVSSKVSSKALSLSVKEGEFVKEGQKLLSLDKTDLTNAYNQAQSAYNSALASQSSVVNSSTKQAAAQANQALLSAQTSYEQAKINYDREKNLFDNASNVKLAKQNYDTAKANYDREKQLYDNASNVKLAKQNYDTAKANYDREKQLFDNASNVKLATQSYIDAKNAYDRVKQLFDMGGASQVELDSAKSALVSAEENLKTVEATSSAALDAAKAQMLSAEENLKTVQATESAALDAARASMISAEENLKIAKLTESASLDAAKAALDNAQNALDNAKENIDLTLAANKAALATASASVESARVSLNIAADNLKNTDIAAPIAGYIAKINVTEGQMVSPGTELFSITNTNIVNAEINVTESNISYLSIGGTAYINVRSAGLEKLEASITEINPVKDSMTGLYGVKVSVDNSDGRIKVGMLCDVELVLSEQSDIIKIPSEALINSGDKYYVYVAHGNKAEKREIVIGITDGEFTEVTEGLDIGEDVVVAGKDYLSEMNNDINVTGEYEEKNPIVSESDASEHIFE